MKRLFCIFFAFFLVLSVFGKEIPLQVTENEWGIEISNLDAKGKRICKGGVKFETDGDIIAVFKTNKDNFSIEKLIRESVFYNLSDMLSLDNITFSTATRDIKSGLFGQMVNYDSILVICKKGEIKDLSAYSDGKIIQVKFSTINDDANETLVEKLFKENISEKERIEQEKKAEEERLAAERKKEEERLARIEKIKSFLPWKNEQLNEFVSSANGTKSVYKTEEFAYRMNRDGDLDLLCYLGESKESLKIPEKIEGIPVVRIISLHSVSDAKFKTIIIPKTVVEIGDGAFVDLDIEKIVFDKDSKLSTIGRNAFRFNKISEINLPKRTITFGFDVLSDNLIKKISIYKDWSTVYYHNRDVMWWSDQQTENAFIKSDILEEVVFEDGCTVIGVRMFADCVNLKKISIPSTMKKFGACAFMRCTSLSDISVSGIPLAEVEDYTAWVEKVAKMNIKDLVNNTDAIFEAAITSRYGMMTDPFSAILCFEGCPIDLKTKRILLKMGLPEMAFSNK